MAQLAISEILEKTSKFTSRQEKLDFLRKHDSPSLREVLKYGLDPRIKWSLPPGKPPFKYAEIHENHGMLYSQARKLYLFVEGGSPNVSRVKRENLFIVMLESLWPNDADLICSIKDKIIPYEGIDTSLINEAFGWEMPASESQPFVAPPTRTMTATVDLSKYIPENMKVPAKRGRGRPKGAKNKPKQDNQEVVNN